MKAAIVLSLVLAFTLGAFGPSLDAAPTPQRSRFAVTAEKLCNNENAAWEEVSPGVFQCFTHRGSKTIKTRTTP